MRKTAILSAVTDAPDIAIDQGSSARRSWPEIQGDLLEQRFAAWLEARAVFERHRMAAISDGVEEEERYEARYDELSQSLDDAMPIAATTLAPKPYMVWKKFEILEQALYGSGDDVDTCDRRQVWIVAGIKADLLALGIGDMR